MARMALLPTAAAMVLLCGRATPARAFVSPGAVPLRAGGLRALCPAVAHRHATVPRARGAAAPAPGSVRRRLLGALPFSASLAAGLGARAASTAAAAAASVAGPDESWSVVRTPGDGSCLFHAVEITAGTPAAELRAVAADAVSAHADAEFNGASLRQWIEWETGLTPDQYATRMAAGQWGGQVELCLLARGLDTPIQVRRARSMRARARNALTHAPLSRAWASARRGSGSRQTRANGAGITPAPLARRLAVWR